MTFLLFIDIVLLYQLTMTKRIIHFFDKLEDRTRGWLSRTPLLYALIGGVGVVLFWRGIWHIADDAGLSSILSVVIGGLILLVTGVFVSAFIGNRLIISGLSGDKKLAEMTREEIETEEEQIRQIKETVVKIEKQVEKIEKETIH